MASACRSLVGLDELEFANAPTSPDGGAIDASDAGSAPDAADAADAADGGTTYRAEVLADRPVAYFRFDETAPDVLADEIAGGPVASYQGNIEVGQPGALRDPTSKAARFHGDPDRIELGSVFGFPGTAACSFEVWVAPEQFVGYTRVFGKLTSGGGYDLEMHATDGVLFQRIAGGDIDTVRIASIPTTATPVYTHLVVTYGEGVLRIYVGGVLRASAVASVALPGTAASFVIAQQSDHQAPAFVGWMDELAVYDHALSADRVAAHFAAR